MEEAVVLKGELKSQMLSLDGNFVTFEDLIKKNNGKVILIDFWASWCLPCIAGLPDVKRLISKYSNKNFIVIFASIDKYQNAWKNAAIKSKIDTRNSYLITHYQESEVIKKLKVGQIPRYVLYEKNGKIAYLKAPKPSEMDYLIDELLEK